LRKHAPNAAYAAVPRIRVVTVARLQRISTPEGKLFQDFYDSTYNAARADASVLLAAASLESGVRAGTLKVISSSSPPVTIDFRDNDGIVNTARQLFPDWFSPPKVELSRVATVVVADHIDVVGYYEGKNGQPNGFLSSGSQFRDREFGALYREIAARIAAAF
jgi:hypothetical protein